MTGREEYKHIIKVSNEHANAQTRNRNRLMNDQTTAGNKIPAIITDNYCYGEASF